MTASVRQPSPAGRQRDFRLFWLSGAVSRLGSHASSAVLPILVLVLGGSPLTAGVLGTVGAGVQVIVSPLAGVYADRHSRRRLMSWAAMLAAVAMSAIATEVATGHAWWPLLFGSVALEGIATGIFAAAASGALRALLPPENPEGALGLLQAREQAAQLAGPGFGGLLFQWANWFPFLLDGISYVIAAVCVGSMKAELRPQTTGTRPTVRADLVTGTRYLWKSPFLRFVVLWAGGVNLIVGALYLEVVLVSRLRGASAGVIGLMLTLAGCAGLIGALGTPQLLRFIKPDILVVSASWIFAACMLLPVVVTGIWGGGLMLALVSLVSPALSVVLQSKAIMLTPDELQGRVGAALGAMAEGTGAVAPLLGGYLVTVWHPSTIGWAFCGGLAVLACYAGLSVHQLRVPSEDPAAEELAAAPGVPTSAAG